MDEKGTSGPTREEAAALFKMLADLAGDPKRLEAFADPEKRPDVMDSYGLTDEQKQLLEDAISKDNHDLERYGHVAKLIGDAAEQALIPFC